MKFSIKRFVFILVFISGCAETHIYSKRNPEINRSYSSLLIIANVPGMELQTKLEEGLADCLYQRWVKNDKGRPPARYYLRVNQTFNVSPLTAEQIKMLCDKNKCDAVIFISMDAPQSEKYNIDLGSTTTGTYKRNMFGSYSFESRTTNNNIAGTITTFNAIVELVDVATGNPAWRSEAQVSSGMLGGRDDALRSFLNSVADDLNKNMWFEGTNSY